MNLYAYEVMLPEIGGQIGFVAGESISHVQTGITYIIETISPMFVITEIEELDTVDGYHIRLIPWEVDENKYNNKNKLYFVQIQDLDEEMSHFIFIVSTSEEEACQEVIHDEYLNLNFNHRHRFRCMEISKVSGYNVMVFDQNEVAVD